MKHDTGGALPAGGGGGTGPAPGDSYPPLPNRQRWPKYSLAEQAVLEDFLIAYGAVCVTALHRALAVLEVDPADPSALGMAARWRHGEQVCRWMLGMVHGKQQHLAVKAHVAKYGPPT